MIPSIAFNSGFSVINPFKKKSDDIEKNILSVDVYFIQAEVDGCSLYTDQGYYNISYVQPELKAALNIKAPNDESEPGLPYKLLKAYQLYKQAEQDSKKITESDKIMNDNIDNIKNGI